jgi:transforming growth factor-beta-induced protein
MKFFKFNLFAALLAGTVLFTSCDKDDDDPVTAPPAAAMSTIAEIATDNGNFTILLDALTRTDLAATMDDASQTYTVFAPTDQAFMDLLTELGLSSLDEVETALGTEGLKNVLLYHVLGSVVTSDMVSTGYVSSLATNATMDALSFYANTSSGVMINDRATVDTPDVLASNGVIHIIDKVILPLSIYELLELNADYATVTAALGIADGGLDALLSDPSSGPFTLFAPNEAAFGDLLAELMLPDVPALVDALGTDGLSSVLTYHVVSGNVNSDEVPSGPVPTVNGENININTTSGVVITDTQSRTSTVIAVDIQGTNGVVHTINTVLLPS